MLVLGQDPLTSPGRERRVKLNQFRFSEPHVFVLTRLSNAKSEQEMMDPELPSDDLFRSKAGALFSICTEPACDRARSFSVVNSCRWCEV